MGVFLIIGLLIRIPIWVGQWVSEHWIIVSLLLGVMIWYYGRSSEARARRRAERKRREQNYIDRYYKQVERHSRAYQEAIAASGIDEIDSWAKKDKGTKFEDRMAIYFEKLGCRVQKTRITGDFGADLIVYNPETRRKAAIQCKCYDLKYKVTIGAVQEVLGGMHHYNADYAMVITNSRLTKSARELAKSTNVDYWERDELVKRLAKENTQTQSTPHNVPEPVK